MKHITDDHDALLDYLYEEGDPTERLAIARHLQECAACAVGVLEFQNVRGMLRDWVPPASPSVNAPVTLPGPLPYSPSVERPSRRYIGVLMQAAAAVLIFAAGMAVSQIRFEQSGPPVTQSSLPAGPVAPVQAASVPPVVSVPVAGPEKNEIETEKLLQRVRAMIDQSEQRQQRELALRLSQVTREVDTQHQADLIRLQQDFGQQQDATMDLIVRTSGGVK
jgi:anti-sigma factor RsiW